MNYEKEGVENNVTPLLGNSNSNHSKDNHSKMLADTGSDCPYTKLNDESTENFESNLNDMQPDSLVDKVGDHDDFSLHIGPKIHASENVMTETRPYIGLKDDAPEYH